MPHRTTARHRAAGAALAAAVLVVATATSACGPLGGTPTAQGSSSSSSSTGSTSSPSPTPSDETTTTPAPTTPSATATSLPTGSTATGTPTSRPTATATGTTTPPVTEQTTLREGMKGPVVLAAQQRLSSLGYWLGRPDGTYGYLTSQAVMALQKASGLGRDGVLGPRTKAALSRGVRPHVRTGSGSAIEVDKARQLVLVVSGGSLKWVLNTSTGSGRPYTSQGHDYVATTPEGRFSVQRQIDGERISHLGALWRPKYFTGGYALHGSPSVPGYPASHGCVRLSNPAIDMLWSSGLAPIGRTVWVY